jgi:hypothetical protein
VTPAERDVLTERERQRHRWGDEHDDRHDLEDLAEAAAHLAEPEADIDPDDADDESLGWAVRLKGRLYDDRRKQLVVAAALLVAEIDRLDRKTTREGT